MKTPINKETISQEITYSWWKYLLLIVAAIFGWNILYTTTAYRSPEYLKVELYGSAIFDQSTLNAYMEKVRTEEMSDMEVMDSVVLTGDDYYGAMQTSTYIMAGEGDVYLLDTNTFKNYASSGAFLPLEEDAELVALAEANGCALDRGWRNLEDDGIVKERHLYGIPANTIPKLQSIGIAGNDHFFCLLGAGGNTDNAQKFLRILLRDMLPDDAADPTATPTDTVPVN